MKRLAIAAMILAQAGLLGSRAWADDVEISGSVIGARTSPVTLTRCHVKHAPAFFDGLAFNGTNRTNHQLLSYAVTLRFYDAEQAPIGATTITDYPPAPVMPDDTAPYVAAGIAMSLSEPASAVSRVTCQVTAAAFTGNRVWSPHTTWPEKLRPLQQQLGDAPPPDHTKRNVVTNAAPIGVFVANAWNDAFTGGTIVHAAVVLAGGTVEKQVRPTDLMLTMYLANGGRRRYAGMAQPAPQYQRTNALLSTTTIAYEVDPAVDLGRMGSIIVPAHSNVRVTVSFYVADPVANANDNRNVTIVRPRQ